MDRHYLLGQRVQPPLAIKGCALNVAAHGTGSYYHWLLDEIPRYLLVSGLSFDAYFASRDTAQNRAALHLLGLDPANFFFIDEKRRRRHFSADLLICPSYVAPTGEPSPRLVSLLSAFVEPLIDNTLTYPERVYISRAGATSRRVRQEHELEAALHQQGYATIKLEDLTWQEQINLFFHAREICAPHGAGLANLVFCSRKPLVVELFPATYVHWCFWKLARLVGADYVPFAFPYGEVEHRNGGAHIDIDPSDVSMIVKAVRRYR
jgi:hypothetical protein